jgi:hypothetical protein
MRDYTGNVRSKVDINEPLFKPFPSEVEFIEYEAYGVYTQKLSLR